MIVCEGDYILYDLYMYGRDPGQYVHAVVIKILDDNYADIDIIDPDPDWFGPLPKAKLEYVIQVLHGIAPKTPPRQL